MKGRTTAGVLAAAAALVVVTATPGNAASTGVVGFAGTVRLATAADGTGQASFCFLRVSERCLNGVSSSGIAAGAISDPNAVDGMQGTATYSESCVSGVPVTGTATITAKLHQVLGAEPWSKDVSAQWTRAGLVAVIQGGATGVAVFAPTSPAACGTPTDVAVIGAVEVAY